MSCELACRRLDGDQSFRLRVFSLTSFSPTSRFADETKRSLDTNLPRSFSHDTKKCDTLVYNSFFRPLIRRKKCGNWPITLAKQLNTVASSTLGRYVSETTLKRSDVCFYERKDDHTFSFQISLCVKSVSFLFLPLYCYKGLVKIKGLAGNQLQSQ